MDTLKKLRQKMGETQLQVAEYLQISQQAYANYEAGRRSPDSETLVKLAEHFHVSVDYLLGREEKKEPSLDEQLEGIDFALFDGARGLDDSQKRAVLKFIKMLREEDE